MISVGTAALSRARTALTGGLLAGALLVAVLTPGAAAAAGAGSTPAQASVERVDAAHAADPDEWSPAKVSDDHATGEVHSGLRESQGCHGGFAVEDSAGACSHGPDPAPAGVDVRDVPAVSELREEARSTSGDGTAAAGGEVPCYGDGTSGKRVQVIYAVAADRPDRFGSVAELIRGYAADADSSYALSARRDGGVRHVRWVTDGSCQLAVDHVVLSPSGDDSISNTRTELRGLGYTSNNRKYLVFGDAGVYCGISYVAGDDRPDASNPANFGATVSRIDAACWGGRASVPAHELAHALGAVQLSAPHSNGGYHCTDEYDRLCYNDGTGATLTYLCASSEEPLLDCNGDDYFNVAPVPGSWLATHWNLANSAFLESVEPASGTTPPPATTTTSTTTTTTDTTTTTSPPPATTTTTVPPPTTKPARPHRTKDTTKSKKVTTTLVGRLTKGKRMRSVRVTTEGRLVSTARFSGASRVRVIVRDQDGQLVTKRRLRSGLALSRFVRAGTYRVTVKGRSGVRFTLRVRHAR